MRRCSTSSTTLCSEHILTDLSATGGGGAEDNNWLRLHIPFKKLDYIILFIIHTDAKVKSDLVVAVKKVTAHVYCNQDLLMTDSCIAWLGHPYTIANLTVIEPRIIVHSPESCQ